VEKFPIANINFNLVRIIGKCKYLEGMYLSISMYVSISIKLKKNLSLLELIWTQA